jgi:FAD/FMN-containing dehydrogenase
LLSAPFPITNPNVTVGRPLTQTLIDRLLAELGPGSVDLSVEERQNLESDAIGRRGLTQAPAMPLAIIRPDDAAAAGRALALANESGVPVVPYGAGTGLMGGARTVVEGLVLDTSKLRHIEVRPDDQLVWAGAGAVLADVDKALRMHGLCLGHDPWTFPVASVGGPISTNGLGYKGGRYGGMADQVVALEIALADGTVFRTPAVPRRSVGPDYLKLFIGAEGTLGLITAAALRAYAAPESQKLIGFNFGGFEQGFEVIRELTRLGLRPSLCDYGEEHASPWPEVSEREEEPPILYLGFEGFAEEVGASTERARKIAAAQGGVPVEEERVRRFWDDRHVVAERFARTRRRERDSRRSGFDYLHVALPASKVLDFRNICHAKSQADGIGLLECGLWVRPELFSAVFVGAPGPDVSDHVAEFMDSLLWTVQDFGGSMEYVHGAGLRLAHLMEREHGAGMTVLRRIKAVLDPNGIMNPGKLGL